MHPAWRATYLITSGLLAVAGTIAVQTLVDGWGWADSAIVMKMITARIKALSAFQVVAVAVIISMVFPAAIYGSNVLSGSCPANNGWGEHPELEIFLATSIVLLPLMLIFSPDDRELQGMSRAECGWPFVILWWAHGAINVIHVRRILAQQLLEKP
jgi:hypothetical protein